MDGSSTHARSGGHDTVREHKQIQTNQLEDVLEEADDLQGEHVLKPDQQSFYIILLSNKLMLWCRKKRKPVFYIVEWSN